MGVRIKKVRLDMKLRYYEKDKIINPNEIYHTENFNLTDLDKLKGNIKIIE